MRASILVILMACASFALGCSERQPEQTGASVERSAETSPPPSTPSSVPFEPEDEPRRAQVTSASLGASWPFERATTSVEIVCEAAGPMMQWPGGARFALTRGGARPGRPLLDPEIFNPDALKRGVSATQARAVLLARAEEICV